MYQIRRTVYEEIDLEPEQLVTIAEAARMIGSPLTSVVSNLDAGRLTEVINLSARLRQARRLLLRAEVDSWAETHRREEK